MTYWKRIAEDARIFLWHLRCLSSTNIQPSNVMTWCTWLNPWDTGNDDIWIILFALPISGDPDQLWDLISILWSEGGTIGSPPYPAIIELYLAHVTRSRYMSLWKSKGALGNPPIVGWINSGVGSRITMFIRNLAHPRRFFFGMLWHVVSWFHWWNQPNPSWWKSRSFSRTSMNHNDKDQPFPAKLGHPPKQGWLRKDNSPESTPKSLENLRFRDYYSKLLRGFSEKLLEFVSASGVEFLRRGTSLVKWSFAECPFETEPSNLWIIEVVKCFFHHIE